MISSKYISAISILLTAVVLVLCVLAMGFSDVFTNHTEYSMEYQDALFDQGRVLEINIKMEEASWDEMLQNALQETYYECDVTVNDTTFYSVGIRPKGNTSLSSVANDPDNNRYSFKLEFDQFVDGQTCFGLDKLVLNNHYADTTGMKEAVIYDMYHYLGADASLYQYAKISVNGEYFGVYLALEAVEDSFMLRNFGTEKGYLYKPDGMNMAGGNREAEKNGFPDREFLNGERPHVKGFHEMQDGEGRTPGGFGGGANLNYTDDELSSYSTIWDGAISDSSETDHKRVVTALKNISQGTSLGTYLDVDNILKYMAVHSFAVNDDSLSGNMAHNYYLYESGGKLNILPWDYNLAFGGMHSGDASDMINDPIDSPFEVTTFFDALLENEEYKARYHEYYRQLVENYIDGGEFDKVYDRIRSQINGLVETDPNAMYTYEEYEKGASMLYDTVMLRAKSVLGQLDGAIPSTTDGQRLDHSALVDASAIDTSVMGQMMDEGRFRRE